MLQWVRGPKTAVSLPRPESDSLTHWLQWVRGPKTAVSAEAAKRLQEGKALQWVRGPKTAVSSFPASPGPGPASGFNGSAVRRPRLAFRDCDLSFFFACFNGSAVRRPRLAQAIGGPIGRDQVLQWVRGPKTAVSKITNRSINISRDASMGPRSEDRG